MWGERWMGEDAPAALAVAEPVLAMGCTPPWTSFNPGQMGQEVLLLDPVN